MPRGPFTESVNWIRAHLTLVLNDQEKSIKSSDDKAEIEDAQHAKDMAERLLKLLPVSFLPTPTLQSYLHSSTATFPCEISSLMTMERLLASLTGSVSRLCHYGELVNPLDSFREKREMRIRKGINTLQKIAKKILMGLTTKA